MLTSIQCLNKYGSPYSNPFVETWVNNDRFPNLPFEIKMNVDLIPKWESALELAQACDVIKEIESVSCVDIRTMRALPQVVSLHSWGVAIDINKGCKQMNWELVDCFRKAGLDWGGFFDPQEFDHFQLKVI